MKLLTDKASLRARCFTNNILSELTALQAASDFALLLFFVWGRFMVAGLLWLDKGQKRSERADRG
jgi:hypothetical protein